MIGKQAKGNIGFLAILAILALIFFGKQAIGIISNPITLIVVVALIFLFKD